MQSERSVIVAIEKNFVLDRNNPYKYRAVKKYCWKQTLPVALAIGWMTLRGVEDDRIKEHLGIEGDKELKFKRDWFFGMLKDIFKLKGRPKYRYKEGVISVGRVKYSMDDYESFIEKNYPNIVQDNKVKLTAEKSFKDWQSMIEDELLLAIYLCSKAKFSQHKKSRFKSLYIKIGQVQRWLDFHTEKKREWIEIN